MCTGGRGAHLTRGLTVWEGHCRGGYKHARCAWSTVFGSGPKCFSLVLDLGADATGSTVDCTTWVASEIMAPLTSLGSCREVRCKQPDA